MNQNLAKKNTGKLSTYLRDKDHLLLLTCLLLLFADKTATLIHYSFQYSDLDQMIAWNCAYDYSQGIFHEPFFYGQAYNYMLESVLAVPLVWFGVPTYIALPLSTTCIALLPFLVLSRLLWKKKMVFWACLALCVPVLLPMEYNMLTSMSRGFIQAYFFLPLLFIPLINPSEKTPVTLFYIGAALCFFSNQGSIILILPIGLYLFMHHYKSWQFYTKALWVVPIFALDWWAKHFYVTHPQHDMFPLNGVFLDKAALIQNLTDPEIFTYLFPFVSGWGFVYPYLFIVLLLFCIWKKKYKEAGVIVAALLMLILSLAVSKTTVKMQDTWVFFTPSRLFLCLPILFLISCWLTFGAIRIKKTALIALVACAFGFFIFKNRMMEKQIENLTSKTTFAIPELASLKKQVKKTDDIAVHYQVDLILTGLQWRWDPVYLALAYYPLSKKTKPLVFVQRSERRSWLYTTAEHKVYKTVLLYVFDLNPELLKKHDFKLLSADYILIRNNKMTTTELMKSLDQPISRY